MSAAGMLGIGAVEEYDVWVLSSRGVTVRADVIEEHGGRDSRVDVEFTTVTGETVRADTSLYRLPDGAYHLDVIYDPRNPSRMQGADPSPSYFWAGYWLLAGAAAVWLTIHTGRHGLPDWLRNDRPPAG